MALTDAKLRSLRPGPKPYKVADGGGLFVLVAPTGGRLFRFKYRVAGREKLLAFGAFPEVSLAEARRLRDEARRALRDGADPGEVRKLATSSEKPATFGEVAKEWLDRFSPGWAPATYRTTMCRLERHVFPFLADEPIAELTAATILGVLRRVEDEGALETAHRIKGRISEILRYGVATSRCARDVTPDLRGAIPAPKVTHRAALIETDAFAGLLRALWDYDGTVTVRAALKLAPLLAVRPGELRQMEWSELDLDRAEWVIPADKMKMRRPHWVPLPTQAVEILRELRPETGSGRYVFPCARTRERPMSDGAVTASLRRMGFQTSEVCGHGMRASFRSIADETLGIDPRVLEAQLAHAVANPLGNAYERTTHTAARRDAMQRWANYCDQLRVGNVIPFPGSSASRTA